MTTRPALAWRRALAWLAALVALALVFASYLAPDLVVTLATRMWSCL